MKRIASTCLLTTYILTSFNSPSLALEVENATIIQSTSGSKAKENRVSQVNVKEETTVINVTDYGAVPDSGLDAGPAVQQAIAAAKEIEGPVTLNFPSGNYDFFPEGATKLPYFISNTASESQNADVTKTIGILIKEMKDVTIEGNGSLLLFHGEMTSVVIDESEDIAIQNIQIDYSRPTTSEMEIQEVGNDYLVAKIHEDSLYQIEGNNIVWTSELGQNGVPYWKFTSGNAQVFDPKENIMRRTWNPGSTATRVEEINPFLLKFNYNNKPDAKVGQIFTMREDVRDQVGMFIYKSKDIVMEKVGMHYMHGLGVVFQYSENLTVDNVDFAPRAETGRVTAGFADFLQVSGGRGLIKVVDSRFSGSNDDPINVHGTHLQVVKQPAPNQIVVRFMHHQTYGFDAFFPKDEIEFIHTDSLTAFGGAKVTDVERKSDREILLTLDRPTPEGLRTNDVVENVTWTPEVEIRGNHFERVPTRGVLLTTRQKVVIEDNVFLRPQMSAILIANDSGNWYESGMVKDVTIRGNEFIEAGNPVINIHPENRLVDWKNPVHRNIRIEDNMFRMTNGMTVDVKSTEGFSFVNNAIISPRVNMNFNGSSNVNIGGNKFEGKDVSKTVTLNNSFRNSFTIDANQGFTIVDDEELVSATLSSDIFELDRSKMTATATSFQANPSGNSPDKVLDGDESSIWHSQWDPYAKLPQSITIDLKGTHTIDGLRYLPRTGETNGNIKEYNVYVSGNGEDFIKVANGQWENTSHLKEAKFSPEEAAFVRLEAIDGQGGWASAAEIYIDKENVINPGDQIPLQLNVKKKNGQKQDLKNVEIAYSSDNHSVATVDEKGVVTAIVGGTAHIKVKVIKDGITVEDIFTVTVTDISAGDVSANNLKALVERLAEDGEFSNQGTARSLQVHLTAVSQYEKQEVAGKVVKHMQSFKLLLDQQFENKLISDKAYKMLLADANALIKKWK
ncbi:discoidin domain-containing protein [Sporosarcina sp. NPDC096371]|uniref:alpha-1,3-galactosidase-related protein n=1 Tax=Sporosarcina sp. NPDC096371 TaxID=3364530 RepID=UPI0037F9B22E